jgi:hypothetical protein
MAGGAADPAPVNINKPYIVNHSSGPVIVGGEAACGGSPAQGTVKIIRALLTGGEAPHTRGDQHGIGHIQVPVYSRAGAACLQQTMHKGPHPGL